MTLYLLSRERVAAQILVYIFAIFLTYLTLGAMMTSDIDALLPSVRTAGDGRLEFIVQGVAESRCCSTRSGHRLQLDARYDELRMRFAAGARETMLWIFGLVGGGLLFWSAAELIARLR